MFDVVVALKMKGGVEQGVAEKPRMLPSAWHLMTSHSLSFGLNNLPLSTTQRHREVCFFQTLWLMGCVLQRDSSYRQGFGSPDLWDGNDPRARL